MAEGAKHTRGASEARRRNCNLCSRTPHSHSTSRHTTTGIREWGGVAAVAVAVGGWRGSARPIEPRTTASPSGEAGLCPWKSAGPVVTRCTGLCPRRATAYKLRWRRLEKLGITRGPFKVRPTPYVYYMVYYPGCRTRTLVLVCHRVRESPTRVPSGRPPGTAGSPLHTESSHLQKSGVRRCRFQSFEV